MTRTHRSLFATAALALILPSVAASQEAGDAGPAVEVESEGQSTIVTVDSAAATTDATVEEVAEIIRKFLAAGQKA